MLDTKKVRLLLRIDEEDINEKDLQQYIDYFIETTLARIGPAAEKDTSILENPTFEEAVMAAIACRLSLTELDIIHAPSGYKVGDTEEEYKNTSYGNYGQIPSWCDQYSELLDLLSSKYTTLSNVQIFRRQGMSVRKKWYRDLY